MAATIGDSFMCATYDAHRALGFALDIQRQFHAHDWGSSAINDAYLDKEDEGQAPLLGEAWGAFLPQRLRTGLYIFRPLPRFPAPSLPASCFLPHAVPISCLYGKL